MELDYEKLLSEDHVLTDSERGMIIVAYHKKVVEWFMDGIVFPFVYLASVICAIRLLLPISDLLIK